jgi:hypothetical protein
MNKRGDKAIEIVRVKITDAGRRALPPVRRNPIDE